jgi:hypothetical protein
VNPANTPPLIAWRRSHTLRQVIDAIRSVAPTRLFVGCDGPSPVRASEAEKVAAILQVIEHEIDWPCQIERLYSDVNQGCRLGGDPRRHVVFRSGGGGHHPGGRLCSLSRLLSLLLHPAGELPQWQLS